MPNRTQHRPDTSAVRLAGLDAALGLTRDQLELLALHTDVVDVRAGERLCRAGQYPRQFLVVIDGYVDVTGRSGRAQIAGPGTWIGGLELVEGVPHHETVVARSDCRLVVIFGPAFTLAIRTSRRAALGVGTPEESPTRPTPSQQGPQLLMGTARNVGR